MTVDKQPQTLDEAMELYLEAKEALREKDTLVHLLSSGISQLGHDLKNKLTVVFLGLDTQLGMFASDASEYGLSQFFKRHLEELREAGRIFPEDITIPDMPQKYTLEIIVGKEKKPVETYEEYRETWLYTQTDLTVGNYESTHKQKGLLQALLDWNRAATGSETFAPIRFDLGKAVRSIAGDSQKLAEHKGLYLNVEAKDGLQIHADYDALSRTVENLIGNAIKYTDKGGATVRVLDRDGRVYLEVADTGRGIPKSELGLIGQPFQRMSTRGEVEGTGLGLATAYELIKRFGGEPSVESEVGQGSTFRISLPLAKKCSVITTTDASSGNTYLLYQSDFEDQGIQELPFDTEVGATLKITLGALVGLFGACYSHWAGLSTEEQKALETNLEMQEDTRREHIRPNAEALCKRLEDIASRIENESLHWLDTNLGRFKDRMIQLMDTGMDRASIDCEFKAETMLLPKGHFGPAVDKKTGKPLLKRGEGGYMQTIEQRDNLPGRFRYELGQGYRGPIANNLSPEKFLLYVIDDICAETRRAENLESIPGFDAHIGQKGLAILYSLSQARHPSYEKLKNLRLDELEIRPGSSEYDLAEHRFRQIKEK